MPEERIGFIGTGVMGRSMARHLIDGGYPMAVHNRSADKAQELVERGAVWCDTPAAAAGRSDVVITMVGYPRDVEEVYLGSNGIVEAMPPGGLAIDMTTSSPMLAVRIADAAAIRNIDVLDAPVSGGDRGAREGTLSIMVGGGEDAFERARPIFDRLGTTAVLQGASGAGQHTKMANQIAIAAGMVGVCEAMIYARRAGLDPFRVLGSIEHGAAGSWSLSNLMPRALRGDLDPGFFVKHFIKDMKIALDAAAEMGISLPGLALAEELYQKLAEDGGADLGTQALLRLYADGKV